MKWSVETKFRSAGIILLTSAAVLGGCAYPEPYPVYETRPVVAQRTEYGVVESGDAKKLGIGAMTDARWQDFFDVVASQGQYKKDLDWRKAYTLQFVNKKK